eukprot:1365099-Amorphochlora_amoeboformis.AAC.1
MWSCLSTCYKKVVLREVDIPHTKDEVLYYTKTQPITYRIHHSPEKDWNVTYSHVTICRCDTAFCHQSQPSVPVTTGLTVVSHRVRGPQSHGRPQGFVRGLNDNSVWNDRVLASGEVGKEMGHTERGDQCINPVWKAVKMFTV